MSPAYDLLNSMIAQKNAQEEMALPLRGKKNQLTRHDFFDYFAKERLGLNQNIIADIIQTTQKTIPTWKTLIAMSFLSKAMQEKYLQLLTARAARLELL